MFLACSAESTTVQVIPLRSRAPAAARIWSIEATRENSASASLLGPEGSAGTPVAGAASTSPTTDFREALVDQRNRHGALAYGGRAALDRPTPYVASGEQPGEVRFER